MGSAIANVMFDFVQALEGITSADEAFEQLTKVTDFFGLNSFAI